MYESVFERSLIWICLFGCCLSIFFYIYGKRNQERVVFCDVGQGDGAFIELKNNVEILVDTGPDKKMLECLGKYMPFFDNEIEAVFISHPQKDHYGGLPYIKDHYKIDNVFISSDPSQSKSFSTIVNQLIVNKSVIRYIYQDDEIDIEGAHLLFLWPPSNTSESQNKKTDSNLFSQIFVFSTNTIKILFTGDATGDVFDRLPEQSIPIVDIVKIPHHGSYKGLTEKFFILADPYYSVISVGKNNHYGHPSPKIIDLLTKYESIIKRTDINSDVIFPLK